MNEYLEILRQGNSLSEQQMVSSMNIIMDGHARDQDLEEFLVLLAERGETVEEITGAARVMREKALSISAPDNAIDCCGTGGDQKGTYNISTAVALVSAACGIPVAKHGNRAASSKSGAADVLEVLGVNLDLQPADLERALRTLNFAFLMAPQHHQAMKHVRHIRQKLGTRTIFNLLGPLSNPASTQFQLLGVFDKQLVIPIAETLKKLGTKRAWVVHGSDGLDEITLTGSTHIAILDEAGGITPKALTPEDFGLPYIKIEDILGGDAHTNAKALRAVLEGERCAYRDIILANAAAVINIHNPAKDLLSCVSHAAHLIDSGAALQTLNSYITFSQEAKAA